MKTTRQIFLFLLPLFLIACSAPAYEGMVHYESALSRADSLVRSGVADSAQAVHLLSDLHREYLRLDGGLERLAFPQQHPFQR